MKNKNIIWAESIITTIIGAILGVIISYFTDNLGVTKSHLNIKWIILVFLLALTLLLVALIFIKIDTLKADQVKLFTDTFYGFRAVDDDISEFAMKKLKKCCITRIVGTARHDAIEKNNINSAINYLRCIEDKLNDDKHFVCRRITSSNVSECLKNHLLNCTRIVQSNNNVFDVAYTDNFDFNISYQIFDNYGLLLIVDNFINGDYVENALGLWTENQEMVRAFINRFDYGWNQIQNIEIKA